jgi:hypothetical protein
MGEPRHPGPRPPGFSYPYAEAARARSAIVQAASRLQAMVRIHRLALPPALDGFEGRTRQEFEPRLAEVLEACEAHAEALLSQADLLDHELEVARRREDAAREARARWQRELDRWTAAQRQAVVP